MHLLYFFFPDIPNCKDVFIGKVMGNTQKCTADFAGIIMGAKQCLNNIHYYKRICSRDEDIATQWYLPLQRISGTSSLEFYAPGKG